LFIPNIPFYKLFVIILKAVFFIPSRHQSLSSDLTELKKGQ